MQDRSIDLKCPNCGSVDLVYDHERGEIICIRCGTVVQERVIDFENPEYRVFDNTDFTKIHYHPGELRGTQISIVNTQNLSNKLRFSRLGVLQQYLVYDNLAKIEKYVKDIIIQLGKVLGLSNELILHAQKLVKKFLPIVKNRGRSGRKLYQLIAIACIVITCFTHGVSIDIKMILEKAHQLYNYRFNAYEVLNIIKQAGFSINNVYLEKKVNSLLSLINEFIDEFISSVDDKYIIRKVMSKLLNDEVLSKFRKVMHVTSTRTKGFVVTLFYIVTLLLTKSKITQKNLARKANIVDVTIRNYLRRMNNIVIELELE